VGDFPTLKINHMLNTLRGEFAVNINETEQKVLLNMNAFRLLTQRFKVGLHKLDGWLTEDPLTALPAIAYCGIENAWATRGEKFTMDFEAFCASFFADDANVELATEGLTLAFGGEGDDAPGKK